MAQMAIAYVSRLLIIINSATVVGTSSLQGRCPHRSARMLRPVTKKVENILSKNEANLLNHKHLMWQVDYTFSGCILTQAVFGGHTHHGGKKVAIV